MKIEREAEEFDFGAKLQSNGVLFRLWAPHADRVSVIGTFNDWNPELGVMKAEANGCWSLTIQNAQAGDEYRYLLKNGDLSLSKIDPYSREVTNSIGNAVIYDPHFDWDGDKFQMPPWNEVVIYEMHVGTFGAEKKSEIPADLNKATHCFSHLKRLGVNAIQIMPVAEFAGDVSWGYNPAHIFAVESAYGGPQALKEFVKQAHSEGFAVILDVVYNHFGPGDLFLWQFDGWSEHGQGGIYFYNDWRNETPWGSTRPDYGRGEIRQYIYDNAMMWLDEYHIDGLRWDATAYVRTVRGGDDPGEQLPDGWSLMQWINGEIHRRFPRALLVAEDLRNNDWITKDIRDGGAGFGAQWDAGFVHPIRAAVTNADDATRSMGAIRDALLHAYGGDGFQRIVYSESHDEVANGKARVPHEISPGDPDNWFAQKRSTLAAALVFFAPGIPMLFQGQEFLQGMWFRDDAPLDWDQNEEFAGIARLYRDLILLRLNRKGTTRGLCGRGARVHHVNEEQKVIGMHRWDKEGPGDDVVVVANFSDVPYEAYKVGFPQGGEWNIRFNSDWTGYSKDFAGFISNNVIADDDKCDGFSFSGKIGLGPYSAVFLSQDI